MLLSIQQFRNKFFYAACSDKCEAPFQGAPEYINHLGLSPIRSEPLYFGLCFIQLVIVLCR